MENVLVLGGVALYFIGLFMLVVVSSRVHALWGFGVFFVPFVALIFAARHWEEARRSFITMIAGIVLVVGTVMMAPAKPDAVAETPAAAKTEASVISTSRPYVPPPSAYTPPPQPAPVTATQAPEPERPMIEQVYADNATSRFYSAKCKQRPENAYRVAKSVAVRQGFTEAPCP